MRWLVGWSGTAPGARLEELAPVGGRQLWPWPNPLWAVGDWRPDEVRTVTVGVGRENGRVPGAPRSAEDRRPARTPARLTVVGRCGATDGQLRGGLQAAFGGALRHLTAWPGSYTAVLSIGPRTVVLGDLAGACPVFHTPWSGGTAFATAALPLADLVGALPDPEHLALRLACPEWSAGAAAPDDSSVYAGVRRIAPGHALTITTGRPLVSSYEASPATIGGPVEGSEAAATAEVTRTLLEAVRCRVRYPRSAAPSTGSAQLSTDLTGGSASTALALLAARIPSANGHPANGHQTNGHRNGAANLSAKQVAGALQPPPPPGAEAEPAPRAPVFSEDRWGDPRSYRSVRTSAPAPGEPSPEGAPPRTGAVRGSWTRANGREPEAGSEASAEAPAAVLALTSTDSGPDASRPTPAREAELRRARTLAAESDRLEHRVVPGGPAALPYADLADDPLDGPLTDEPGPGLVGAARLRARLAVAGTDHLTGYGARQALDGHPARLADLLLDRRARQLVKPVAALARTDGRPHTPVSVLRAARRLAHTDYAEGLEEAAVRLLARRVTAAGGGGKRHSAGGASVDALAWCVPGPAAAWLTDDALSAVAVRLRLAARRPVPDERPGSFRARLALHRQAADFRVLAQAVEGSGNQRLHAPFLDNQVIRACRRIPDAARLRPGARHAVLRAALTGAGVAELPADWGTGVPPGPYTSAEAVRAGLRFAAPVLDELFAEPLLAEAGLIDADAVRAAVRAAMEGRPAPLDGIADVIATEVWLRRHHARRGSCWTGMPVAQRRAIAAGGVAHRA